eukprot:Hpha_TRINITY_DN16537_c0_g8::TRINITY_DN16537_c0_g8_i1::g.136557::m.136557
MSKFTSPRHPQRGMPDFEDSPDSAGGKGRGGRHGLGGANGSFNNPSAGTIRKSQANVAPTHPCVYQYGSCTFGDECKFAEVDGLVCAKFLKGSCSWGDQCVWRHPDMKELARMRIRPAPQRQGGKGGGKGGDRGDRDRDRDRDRGGGGSGTGSVVASSPGSVGVAENGDDDRWRRGAGGDRGQLPPASASLPPSRQIDPMDGMHKQTDPEPFLNSLISGQGQQVDLSSGSMADLLHNQQLLAGMGAGRAAEADGRFQASLAQVLFERLRHLGGLFEERMSLLEREVQSSHIGQEQEQNDLERRLHRIQQTVENLEQRLSGEPLLRQQRQFLELTGQVATPQTTPAKPQRPVPQTCDNCGSAESLKLCGGCKQVAFCGTVCQRAAWASHQPFCTSEQRKRSEG